MSWNYNLDEPSTGSATSPYVTFARAGTFRYHCEVHPSTMKGSIVVRMKSTKIDSNSFTIRVASTNAPAGFTHSVQYRKSPSSTWLAWQTFSSSTMRFDAPSAGTWQFHARLVKTSTTPDKFSDYSPTLSVTAT